MSRLNDYSTATSFFKYMPKDRMYLYGLLHYKLMSINNFKFYFIICHRTDNNHFFAVNNTILNLGLIAKRNTSKLTERHFRDISKRYMQPKFI